MKYIDSEKLIAEIERLKEKHGNYKAKNETEKCYKGGRLIGYEDALYKIASLQQEQPEVDLENYLENYFKGWHIEEEIGLTKPDGWSCIVDDIKDIARHFAEWGAIHLNARKKK